MLFESSIVGKCRSAIRADVRADPGMSAQVFLQRVLPSKQLVAHVTLMTGFLVDLEGMEMLLANGLELTSTASLDIDQIRCNSSILWP